MEKEKTLRLLARQLKDIQAQAEKIAAGENSIEALESFSRYSFELKDYIYKNIESAEIRSYLDEIPEIKVQRTQIMVWQYFVLPSWLIIWYRDYKLRQAVIEEVAMVRGKYATLELLVRGLDA